MSADFDCISTSRPLDVASATAEHPSVASVVIEEMGLPNSWPVPFMWYHKAFLLKANRLDELAQQFVADMDAHWCNHIKSVFIRGSHLSNQQDTVTVQFPKLDAGAGDRDRTGEDSKALIP
jgi:hypothetical protein